MLDSLFMPFLIISLQISTAVLTGIQKPIPSYPSAEIFTFGTPTRQPDASTRAPPELPGLIAASVWIRVIVTESTDSLRSRPLIIPLVTEPANSIPPGLPIATTVWPKTSFDESPIFAAVRPLFSILRTARSAAEL